MLPSFHCTISTVISISIFSLTENALIFFFSPKAYLTFHHHLLHRGFELTRALNSVQASPLQKYKPTQWQDKNREQLTNAMVYSVPAQAQALKCISPDNSSRFHAATVKSRAEKYKISDSEFSANFPNVLSMLSGTCWLFPYVAKCHNLQLCPIEKCSNKFTKKTWFLNFRQLFVLQCIPLHFKLYYFLDHKNTRICNSLSQNT